MTPEIAFSLWLVLLGPIAGSFVTALADRHCDGGAVLAARSRCRGCGDAVAATDLFPLLSWPLLRGRCRGCHETIGLHVWLGEWAGLGAAALALAVGNGAVEQLAAAVYFWLLIGLFQSDRRCFRLPDMLTFPLLVVGLVLGAIGGSLMLSLLATATGSGALWLLAAIYARRRRRTGLGLGDVKMMAGLSAAVGLAAIPWITLVAAVAALAVTLVRQRRFVAGQPVPFGCYLALAGAVVWSLKLPAITALP